MYFNSLGVEILLIYIWIFQFFIYFLWKTIFVCENAFHSKYSKCMYINNFWIHRKAKHNERIINNQKMIDVHKWIMKMHFPHISNFRASYFPLQCIQYSKSVRRRSARGCFSTLGMRLPSSSPPSSFVYHIIFICNDIHSERSSITYKCNVFSLRPL